MKQETRKDEIIKTAAKLFKEKGYSAVTMRDLATAMGMKAASLYNHINSKQEILKAIIITTAEEFTNGMNSIMASNDNNISKLKYIVNLHVKITAKNTNAMASLNNDWMHLEDQLSYYLKLRNEYENNFLEIIKQGIKNSEIKENNPEVIMFSMLSTLRSLYMWNPIRKDFNTNDLSESLSRVLIDGINK